MSPAASVRPVPSGRWWGPPAAGLAAVAVGALTAGGPGRDLDVGVYRRLNRGGGPSADRLFRGVTELGSIWASAGAAATLAVRGGRREAADAFGAALAMWTVGQLAKRVVRRPRPYRALHEFRLMIREPQGTSWPSSHPAVLLVFVTVAGRDVAAPEWAGTALTGLAGVVGVSRVYLGVHYPADVVGGLLLGRAVADLWSRFVSPVVVGRSSRPASSVQ